MTEPKPLPKIEKCVCENEAHLVLGHRVNYVICKTECWFGPNRDTEEEAILTWNSLMKRQS